MVYLFTFEVVKLWFALCTELSTEHLETKKRIETLRERFGEENWLHSHAGSCVQDVLGLHKAATVPSAAALSAKSQQHQSATIVTATHVGKILMCVISLET
jgi:hypothetical protein